MAWVGADYKVSRLLLGTATLIFCAALAGPLSALPGDHGPDRPDTFMGLEPMAESELAKHRGGMSVAGMKFNFAVEVRMNTEVLENGDSVFGMTTTLSFDNTQRSRITEIRTPDAQRIVQDTMAATDASLAGSGEVSQQAEGGQATRINLLGNPDGQNAGAQAQLATAALERLGANGSRLQFDDGRTRIMQELAANQLATVIQNVGNQRTINQQVEMDLMISNFTEQVREFNMNRLGQRIGRDVLDRSLGR